MKIDWKTVRRVAVGLTAALGVIAVAFDDLGWTHAAMLVGLAIAFASAAEEGIDAATGS